MNKEEKIRNYLAGKEQKAEKIVSIFDKLKLTWYINTPFSKWIYVLSFLALLFLIVRLIAGQGLW